MQLNQTHDPDRRSWVDSANHPGTDFPLQNLPLGVYATRDNAAPRIGVAIGDCVLDLAAARDRGLLDVDDATAHAIREPRLNALMALGQAASSRLRRAVFELLSTRNPTPALAEECLLPVSDARMQLPAFVGDFTDFYTSIHHASRAARALRPGGELAPNFRHLPIAYHGRASSLVVSGTDCVRPSGQTGPDAAGPVYRPCAALDFEAEVACFVGPGNALGVPISLDDAASHVFGLCLVNDWSARDMQRWEALPLGPFLAKSFMTSVSPWVVTLEALAPFRTAPPPRAADEPAISPALTSAGHAADGAIRIQLQVSLSTAAMRRQGRAAEVIARPGFADQYWTLFQMLTHHASNGCNLRPGDLISSGTVSGADVVDSGCLLERTTNGTLPLRLENGESRGYLEDGDELALRGRCEREGYAGIGFGVCAGAVVPRAGGRQP
ncbi:fumarylacetoacetase [Bordetella genomosp. 9]|uniref:fumarylacetoacetase n=1 Tax=Bordetella genomosp. 9 TaxID=1416803 RepID=A0A261R1L4_9BORD|nr:fumarylacetoacetase [Bordetella genomosp. 9]OZI18928.1 fumarylacetoacetase [Bordetella genomosp. 9]